MYSGIGGLVVCRARQQCETFAMKFPQHPFPAIGNEADYRAMPSQEFKFVRPIV